MHMTIKPNDPLIVEADGRVLWLQLNRPEKRNSLTPDMLMCLHRTLAAAAREDRFRCVVIRGAGDRAFSAGYDIASIPTRPSEDLTRLLSQQSPFEQAVAGIVHYPYPVIAMLNGYAFGGGCDLAVACDLRIGADDIQMGMVPAKLGMAYFPDGLQRFIQIIGFAKTREMFFTARRYKGAALKEMGLVDYLVDRADLKAFTRNIADEIVANAPLALKGTKRIINLLAKSAGLPAADLETARTLVEKTMVSADLKEAQAAFQQKRKPVFKGR